MESILLFQTVSLCGPITLIISARLSRTRCDSSVVLPSCRLLRNERVVKESEKLGYQFSKCRELFFILVIRVERR